MKLFFLSLLALQVVLLSIMAAQGHKINWLAVAIIVPALIGYAMLRIGMAKDREIIKANRK